MGRIVIQGSEQCHKNCFPCKNGGKYNGISIHTKSNYDKVATTNWECVRIACQNC